MSWLLDEMENHELRGDLGGGLGLVGDSGLHTQFVVVGQGRHRPVKTLTHDFPEWLLELCHPIVRTA